MQHLRDFYSSGRLRIHAVEYFRGVNDRSSKHNGDSNYTDFVKFPERHGFQIKDDYTLHGSGYSEWCCGNMTLREFLQEWLFFQLISCVVEKDKKPILPREALTCHNGWQLNTGELNRALTRWHHDLETCYLKDPEATTMRLLEANQILELAKQVVIANLADKRSRLSVPPAKWRSFEPDDEDEQSLCYMVLGETLSAVLVHAMRKCNIALPGWEPDDLGGWGPPAYVYKKMQREGWCPRSQTTIRGQLGRNATLLYVTACAHENNPHNRHGDHSSQQRRCNSKECWFIEAEHSGPDGKLQYEPSHSKNCPSLEECRVVGPQEEEVLAILEKNKDESKGPFPLMRIVDRGGEKGIEVEEWTEGRSFATLSHVWSQGLGNRTERKIHACQLEMIETWVRKAFGDQEDKDHLFWIDTFAIPQNKDNDPRRARLKQRAIGLIPHIFSNATHCIVIDRHILTTLKSIYDGFTFAATLLACGWMTRLWTLQEAAVSAQLHLATRDNHGLRSLNDLWKHTGVEDVVHLSMAHMVQRQVDHNLMVQRKTNHDPVESEQEVQQEPKTKGRHHIHGASLIVRVWRASQYRTISNFGQEARALAILLSVTMSQEPNESNNTTPNGLDKLELGSDRKPEALMRNFWESLCKDHDLQNSIPPGMIFLLGRKLPFPGLGWAPLTWMSGQEEAYPYLLDQLEHPTRLKEGRGLVVKYPGYLLYTTRQQLKKIIKVSRRNTFEFAVNGRLDEWYSVRATDETTYDDASGVDEKAEQHAHLIAEDLRSRMEENDSVQIGIILSRPRPVGETGEIGLLVERCPEDICAESQPPPREQQLLYCRILRQVEVSRFRVSMVDKFDKFEKEGIAGVQFHELQEWCVDGYHYPQKPKRRTPSSKPEDTSSPPNRIGLLERLKRAMTWSLPQVGED